MFYILIAVGLLGALSYAVTSSMRGGGGGQMTAEKDRLLASEMIEFSSTMAQAVSQLRLRGVDADDLCFDDTAWGADDYDHAGCTDSFNKIFHPEGGALTWTAVSSDVVDAGASPDNLWHIYGDTEVNGVGTTCAGAACADLILVADELKADICLEINTLLGVDNPADAPPVDSAIGTTRYVGAFGYTATLADEDAALDGNSAGCFLNDDTDTYTFYKVLIAR